MAKRGLVPNKGGKAPKPLPGCGFTPYNPLSVFTKTFLHVLTLMALSASGILVWIRSRRQDGGPWLPYLAMQASLFSFLLALSIQELQGESGMFLSSVFGFLGVEGVIASAYTMLRFTFNAPHRRAISLVYALGLGTVAVLFLLWVTRRASLTPLGILLQFAALAHLTAEGWIRRKDCADRLLRSVLGDAIVLGIPALPFLIVDPLGSVFSWDWPDALIGNYSLPVFFLALNAATAFRIASWLGRTEPGGAPTAEMDWEARGLSRREGEVASLLREGKSAKDMAQILELSPKTIENHSYRLYRKLGVSTRFEFLSRFGGHR